MKSFGKSFLSAVLGLAFLCLASPLDAAEETTEPDLKQTGTVTIAQTQVAFFVSGNIGGGKLEFDGKTYEFSIGGLGVGGIGASKIKATGEVFNLEKAEDFEGTYGQARYGAVFDDASTGELWLSNPAGVYLLLKAEREGYALSLGADAIYIKFE
jgi:hypothetical protein